MRLETQGLAEHWVALTLEEDDPHPSKATGPAGGSETRDVPFELADGLANA